MNDRQMTGAESEARDQAEIEGQVAKEQRDVAARDATGFDEALAKLTTLVRGSA